MNLTPARPREIPGFAVFSCVFRLQLSEYLRDADAGLGETGLRGICLGLALRYTARFSRAPSTPGLLDRTTQGADHAQHANVGTASGFCVPQPATRNPPPASRMR